jgi:hypothetical protein
MYIDDDVDSVFLCPLESADEIGPCAGGIRVYGG